jgi:O-antigen/teichoic acid export membrane protein
VTGRRVVRDSLAIALSQYVSRAMLLARGLAAAAAMGPAGFGAWNALNLILDYGAYASWGAFYGLDRRLPPAVARGDEAGSRREMRGAWGLALAGVALFAVAVVVYLSAGMWLSLTGWGWSAPLLMLVAALFQVAIHYHTSVLRACGDFGRVGAATTLQAAIGGGVGLATVWRAGVSGLLWGWLLGCVVAIVVLRRSRHRPPLAPAPPREGVPLVRAGFPLFAFFVLSLIIRSVDRIALVRFGGNDALGHYSLGLVASGLVLFPPEAVASVLFPRIAAAAEGARDAIRTRAEVTRAQRTLAALLPLPVGLGALWAGPVVQQVLPAFGGGIWALRILAVGALALAAGTLPGYYLLGSGKGRSALAAAAGAGLLAAMGIFGVASWAPRASAVAIAAAAGQALWAAVMLGQAVGLLAEGAAARRRLWLASFAPALWAGAWMLGLSAFGPETAAAALWRSLGFVAAYLPVLVFFTRGLGLREVLADWRTP